ncbi:MAG: hypothetical protein AAF711_08380 [Planctomycetota bacterium]
MSQSNPGHSQPQSSQASSQALLDELRSAADRAREERLKLARLVKHSAELPVGQSSDTADLGTTPDARFVALSQQIEQLEQTVSEKLQALDQVQQDIESRSQYLESLRHTITDTTRAFVTQVEQAQHFKAHVDAAKQHVKMSAGRVVEDVRQHLAEYEGPIAKRIEQLTEMDEQIDKRIARMQQMHKQASEAVDQHLLAALRTAKEQAGDLAQPVKEQVDKHLLEQAKKIEEAIHAKIADLDVDVEEALSPLTAQFDEIVAKAQAKADALADALPDRFEAIAEEHADKIKSRLLELIEEIKDTENEAGLLGETLPDRIELLVTEQVDRVRGRLTEQANEMIEGLDDETVAKVGERIHQRIAESLDSYLAEADKHAGGYVDGLVAKLEKAREDALASYQETVQKIEADSSIDREQMMLRLDEEVERLTLLADQRLAHAKGIVEGASDGIHARANAAVESALRQADNKIDEYETNSVDRLRVIDQGIEQSITKSYQRLAEHEKEARKQGEEVFDLAENAIAKAQERLAQFEAGITQRVANASQTVDASIASIDERMHRVEQDASARVMQIVDLAEESGRSVSESIGELTRSAQQTAARAQADLDEKLQAFEKISAAALQTAEQTLRSNITELRDSSRAMIEIVTKQVKAQAAEIEPQTITVIDQAEQTMRRRISDLRDSAQGMVELTVSRLEAQLNDVKAKAQQAAFKGIPQQGSDAGQASDAA